MKEDAKSRIIEEGVKLFTKNGIKAITMDDIAEHLGMSKRTIYENFPDKRTLVYECLQNIDDIFEDKYQTANKKAENALEEMLLHIYAVEDWMKQISQTFFEDLKHYPISDDYIKQKEENKYLNIIKIFVKGEKEGLFRSDLEPELIATVITESTKSIGKKIMENNPEIKYSINTHHQILLVFLRGLSTEKGLKVIEELEEHNKFRK